MGELVDLIKENIITATATAATTTTTKNNNWGVVECELFLVPYPSKIISYSFMLYALHPATCKLFLSK